MPIKSDGKSGGYTDENTLYARLWEYAVMALALDHFFTEVVEGNVPLDANEPWFQRSVVPERVNRYSEPWCLLFEGLSRVRARLEDQVGYSAVRFDHNLRATYTDRRGNEAVLSWTREGDWDE